MDNKIHDNSLGNLKFYSRVVDRYEFEVDGQKYDLSSDEFYFYTNKKLNLNDIMHYKNLVSRDLSDKELKIIVLLSANGLLLSDKDFRKHF